MPETICPNCAKPLHAQVRFGQMSKCPECHAPSLGEAAPRPSWYTPPMQEHVRRLRRDSCYGILRTWLVSSIVVVAIPFLMIDVYAISLALQGAPLTARTKPFDLIEMPVWVPYLGALLSLPVFIMLAGYYQMRSLTFDIADALIDISRKLDP